MRRVAWVGLAMAALVVGCDDGEGWDDGGSAPVQSDGGDDGSPFDDGGGGGDDGGPQSGPCAATHVMVGATAVLEESFHDVGGMAEIIDDCTIEIREFTFDGTGIDVRIYAGLGGDYSGGFSISDKLNGNGPFTGETITVKLPRDATLDDLDGISVWCVPVGVDFGSGRF